jgi:Putative zinc-finger
LPLPLGP